MLGPSLLFKTVLIWRLMVWHCVCLRVCACVCMCAHMFSVYVYVCLCVCVHGQNIKATVSQLTHWLIIAHWS